MTLHGLQGQQMLLVKVDLPSVAMLLKPLVGCHLIQCRLALFYSQADFVILPYWPYVSLISKFLVACNHLIMLASHFFQPGCFC